jgi:hypothetical protein
MLMYQHWSQHCFSVVWKCFTNKSPPPLLPLDTKSSAPYEDDSSHSRGEGLLPRARNKEFVFHFTVAR